MILIPLTGIRGKGGSGKNTYFAYSLIVNKKLLDLKKYTNFGLDLPNTENFDTLQLLEKQDIDELNICGIDESYVEFDCRNSMDIKTRLNTYLMFQARKNKTSMVAISQLNINDLRWRELEEFFIYAFDRPILDKNLKDYKGDFKYALCKPYYKPVKFTLPYHTAKKVFRFFNSREKILPEDLDELKWRLNLKNAKTRKELVNKIVDEVLMNNPPLNINTVTHIWLKNEIMDLDMPEVALKLEPFVYIRLRNKL